MMVHEADWICPASGPPVRGGALGIRDGLIHSIGAAADIFGHERVRHKDCVIIPGFVNAHAHLELTVFHGLLDDLPFNDWIANLVRLKYQQLDRDALKLSAQLGAVDMLRAGVTTVGEVMDVGAGWEAMREFGLQGVAYQEVFGPDESAAQEALRGLQAKVEACRLQENASQRVGVSPHAPYTVSRPLYEASRDFARRESLPMTAHIAESSAETLFVRDGEGPFAEAHRKRSIAVTPRRCLPIAYLERLGLLAPDMLLIHAIEADDRDLDAILTRGASVVHCPKSNAMLGHGVARVSEMRARGIPVGLGTDSVASNDSVDMFSEMRKAVALQEGQLSASDAFLMATLEGARALRLDPLIGSLEVGKRADFAVVRMSGSVEDPVSAMVQSSSAVDVCATYIGGKEVSVDGAELARKVAAIANRLRRLV